MPPRAVTAVIPPSEIDRRLKAHVRSASFLQSPSFGFRSVFGVLVVLFILPFLLGHLRHRPWFLRYLRHMRLTTGHTPRLTMTATAASAAILVGLVFGLGASVGALAADPDFWAEDSRWFIVILALVPGIWEELAFRGLMLTNLQQRYHRWVAIVVTGVLFGLMHLIDLISGEPSLVVFRVIMTTTLGIAWGYVTVKTGSVLPAMILHYLINVLIELMLEPELGDTASAAIFGSVTIAYPVLTIIAVWWLRRVTDRHPTHVAAQ